MGEREAWQGDRAGVCGSKGLFSIGGPACGSASAAHACSRTRGRAICLKLCMHDVQLRIPRAWHQSASERRACGVRNFQQLEAQSTCTRRYISERLSSLILYIPQACHTRSTDSTTALCPVWLNGNSSRNSDDWSDYHGCHAGGGEKGLLGSTGLKPELAWTRCVHFLSIHCNPMMPISSTDPRSCTPNVKALLPKFSACASH